MYFAMDLIISSNIYLTNVDVAVTFVTFILLQGKTPNFQNDPVQISVSTCSPFT